MSPTSFFNFFYKILLNIKTIFSGKNVLWHALAIVLTILLVTSGFDWYYYQTTRNRVPLGSIFLAVILGGVLPILVPLILYASALLTKHTKVLVTGFALGQAAMLGSLISSAYKALTGRSHPIGLRAGDMMTLAEDITRQFKFGFWRGGIFWGWPSSHTTIAFAMSVTLIILFPKNIWIRILGAAYALYVGLAVSISIHWFSDFVAGAIIGSLIGVVVGKRFFQKIMTT
jgi:membrane-associated phospholipid phosphatase